MNALSRWGITGCVLLALTGPIGTRTAAFARSAPAGRAATAAPALAGRPGPAPLADTVLAMVSAPGADGPARIIGRETFRHAWSQARPPARPDSLTPAGARRFLELLVDKEAIERLAARERWTWTAQESASHASLADRLALDAVLREEMEATRGALAAAGDSPGAEDLGVAARTRAMPRLAPAWDDSLLGRVARAFEALPRPSSDSSLMVQLRILGAMPVVAPADTGAVLARTTQGDYRVSDLLAMWRRLNPLHRPRIQGAEQVRELAQNGLFERLLRRRADSLRVVERPEVVARLESERRLYDVGHLVEREVDRRIPSDSATLARYYEAHEPRWRLPVRVRLLRVEVEKIAAAATLAGRLADPAQAESLAAQARRQRLPWEVDLSAAEDSALFARAMAAGPGAVIGPEQAGSGWRVCRVLAVQPGRSRPFREVRDLVWKAWSAEDGERRMRALLERARSAVRVRFNEAAIAAVAAGTDAAR